MSMKIRGFGEKFEGELAKGGLTTLMPKDAYTVKSYNWHPTKG